MNDLVPICGRCGTWMVDHDAYEATSGYAGSTLGCQRCNPSIRSDKERRVAALEELERAAALVAQQTRRPMTTHTRGNVAWDEFVDRNKKETMERWRAEIVRLRNWIDREGRNCPSGDTIDAVLEESIRVAG